MIAVIVLNWNNAPDTLECLSSVYASDDPNFFVLVADNGSEDNSVSIIQNAYPQARILLNGENLGFAEGNNRAIRLVMEEDVKYVFLLNNDATIAKSTLSKLRKAADENPNAAVVGPVIFFYDEPATIWHGLGGWDPKRGKYTSYSYGKDPSACQGIQSTETICGCAFFARVSHLKLSGLMDSRYFLNWEEIDWCARLKKFGFDCLLIGPARAWHKVSRSFIGGRGAMWHYFYYRNRLLWMETHLSRKERLRIARKFLWPELKCMVRHVFHPQMGANYRACLMGLRDYCFRRFGKGPKKLFRK